MILSNRLEKHALQKDIFLKCSLGSKKEGGGVGCVKASFAILETINHILEWVCKIFGCFSTFVKPFKQFGLMVLIQIVHSTWNQREVVAMNL